MSSARQRSPLLTIFVTVFLDLLGFGMVIPILALYAKTFGVSDVAVTAMGASYSAMQLLFSPIWGRVSDRYGRRPVLLVSILGSCVSQLGYALAPSFGWLVVARCFAGVCGANISAAQAYIADTTDEKSRAAGMGLLGMAMGLGFVFGPFFGGVVGRHSMELPFFVASALSLGNFVLASFTLVEPARRRAGLRSITWAALARAVSMPRLRVLIVLFFVVTFGFANLEQTFPFYLQRRYGWDHEHVGYVFAYIGLIMIIAQGVLVRRLVGRFGERALVITGIALLGGGMLLAYFARHVGLLVGGVTLVALGSGLHTPSLSSLISRAAGGDRQGGVLGVSQSAGALARILGFTGGWLLAFGEGAPYLFAAAISFAACLFAAATVQRPEPVAVADGSSGEAAGL